MFLSQRQFSNGPILQARVEPPFFIDLFQRSDGYVFWGIQFPASNLAPFWKLIPQEIQPRLIYFHKLIPSIVMVCR